MRVPEPDEERPLAWKAIVQDTPVFAFGGEEIGTVGEVLGSEDEDIFHGLVVDSGRQDVMIPAQDVGVITNIRIETKLSADAVRALPQYVPDDSYQLGVVGLFRKRLGWVRDEDRGP